MAAFCASPFPSPTILTLLRATPRPDHRFSYRRSFSPNFRALTDPVLAPSPSPVPLPLPLPIRRREAALSLSLSLLLFLLDPPAGASSDQTNCTLAVASSGLAFCDTVVGTGPVATKGQLIKAHYVGKLENGKVFDSSYSRGRPLSFRVGVGEVIKGWDQGILGVDGIPPMLLGGKRTLKLPPELGYGARGAGCRGGSCIIPPDSTLLFDIEFIG
ncbi:peptidyl-prolyl cis-trans isomerase FKBP13, chloroplastic-like [Zingiber officinale]|uniref:peptidyl-prolyl cis-trans isomerase FKBP13, chloroplastic-like n=1 Tax=Zingiber officinale TaxID=94328 RepID=UPI001C4B5F0A|nr:peptidyl-prolyl cis-trans isomerase FKBP13, chloroplastic-like [Zingiber officinale]